MRGASILLVLILLLAVPSVLANYSQPLPLGQSQITSTTSQALNSTTKAQKTTYNPSVVNGLRQDIGKFSFVTSLTSIQWNATNNDYLQFNPPTVGPTALSNTLIYYNSTEMVWQMISGLNTVSVFVKPNGYSANIFIQANLASAQQVCLPFKSPTIIVQQTTQVSLTNITLIKLPSVKAGNEVFSWSDIPVGYSPTWNANKLCLNLPLGITIIDPLALDGSSSTSCQNVTSCAITLTTTSSPDVVIVQCNCYYDTSTFSISGDGLTWITRASIDCNGFTLAHPMCMEWAANASSTISGSITITATNAGSYIGLVAFGISGAQTGGSSFDKGASTYPVHDSFGCTAARGAACVYNISTNNAKDFLILMQYNDHTPGMTGGGVCGVSTCTQIKDVVFAGVEQQSAYLIVSAIQSGINLEDGTTHGGCSDPTCTAFDNILSIGDAVKASSGTVTQGIKIITAGGAPQATITISSCGPSNSTFLADGFTHTYSLSLSCTVSLTVPTDGANIRYRWNGSPHPTEIKTAKFATCASGTCTLYQNTTYYELKNTFEANPQTPSVWDGSYSTTMVGEVVGAVGVDSCVGGTIAVPEDNTGPNDVCPSGNWADYNTPVTLEGLFFVNKLGNTWTAQAPNSFTDSTGGNTHIVNYIQSTGSASSFADAPWVAIPVVLLFFSIGGVILYLPKKSRLRD